MTARPELRALTGARGIAAWIVVLFHVRSAIPGLPAMAEALLAKGYLAVDFFFLLSGFVIWLAWADRLRAPAAVPAFLIKRFARIWPLHAVVLGFALALALALRATGRDDPAFPLGDFPFHLLLIQTWGLTDTLAWNDPAWSISCELAAYLAFPLLILSVDWRRWSGVALVATGAAILLMLHLVMRGEPGLGSHIPRFGVVRCLAEFTVGGIVCALWQRAPDRTAAPAAIAAALVLAHWCGAPETLVVPAAFAALLLALAGSAGRAGHPLEGRWVHRLGEISYATYLGHFLLWKAFKLVAVGGAVTGVHVAGYLLAVLLSSALLYDRIEVPAQRMFERLLRPRLPRRPVLR